MDATKLRARQFLSNVPEEYVFRVCNGHILRNMKELGEELKSMSDADFTYHVNSEKNDFTNWVRDIIQDHELARKLQLSKDRQQSARLVAERIRQLGKR